MLPLAGAAAIVFIASIAILMNVIPGPHSRLDYLVIGAVATFLAMIVLFVALLKGGVPGAEQPPATPDSKPEE